MIASLLLLGRTSGGGSEDGVGDAGGFDGRANAVHADNVGTVEDGRGGSGEGGIEAGGDGRVGAVMKVGKSVAEEGFAGHSGEDGAAE